LLKKSHTEDLHLQILLNQIESKNQPVNQIEQLIDLLLGIGILNEKAIASANNIAITTGRNLGEVLLEQNDINASQLDSAWQAQRMIDDKMISFAYACAALRKLTRSSRPSQLKYPQELQQITEPDLPIISQENWLTKITKKLFKK
jgi:hypothetical protein